MHGAVHVGERDELERCRLDGRDERASDVDEGGVGNRGEGVHVAEPDGVDAQGAGVWVELDGAVMKLKMLK